MAEPLLAVENLTVRFGGLTAVENVTLQVQPGEVMAVIGPNGAGKTTVFNVISGIYAPSAGTLHFAGRPLMRPFTWTHGAGWAVLGLFTGLLTMLFGSNVDRLWAVAIKQNVHGVHAAFSLADAQRDVLDYFDGAPHIEEHMGRYQVVSFDGKTTYVSTRDSALAASTLAQVRPQALAAEESMHLRTWLLFAMGCLLGSAGGVALWSQTRRTSSWISRAGVARTFQNNRLFAHMTAAQNVEVAVDRHIQAPRWRAWAPPGVLMAGLVVLVILLRSTVLGQWAPSVVLFAWLGGLLGYTWALQRWSAFSPAMVDAQGEVQHAARELLQVVGLSDRAAILARNLAYGDQRRLEIARALATRPRLLLLDEPAAGMNPTETRALMELIGTIRQRGVAVMLIEHDMKLVMNICERIVVLEYGRKIADGTPAEVRANPAVIKAYLGDEEPVVG